MKKKLFAFFLITGIMLCVLAFGVSAAEPTEISTVKQFMDFMTKSENWAGSYKLTTDIDLTGQEQNPIGNTTTAFTGSFDGDGHTISGINITGTTYTGLFGVVTSNGDQTVIKNFTLKGKLSATKFSGGVVGIILGETLVEDVTIGEDFTFAITTTGGRIGGIVGTIMNSCDLADVKKFQPKESFPVTITGCVNNAAISAKTADSIGGIVGRIFPAVAATKTYAGKTVTNVITISDCVNNGNIDAKANVGGIVGAFRTGYAGNTNTVTNCDNYGIITGYGTTSVRVGGIVGWVEMFAKNVHFLAEKCYNEGHIKAVTATTGNSVIGGIVGHMGTGNEKCTVSQCWNAGDVTAAGNMAGGIVGAPYPAVIEDCYNSGTVSAGGTKSGGIFSYTEYKASTFRRNYTTGEGIGLVKSGITPTMASNYDATATEFDGLNDNNAWIFTDNGPELAYFHVHDLDAKYVAVEGGHVTSCYCNDVTTIGTVIAPHTLDRNGLCTANCGYSECEHKETAEEITLSPTCVATGLKDVICTLCGEVQPDVVVDEDPDNHAYKDVTISYDDLSGIVYKRVCCETDMYTQTALTDIYVSSNGIEVTTDYVFESAIGGTSETAFKDFELAMQYAAASVASGNEAVTIHIVDNAYVPADYATPEYNGMIIVTGGTLNFDATPRHWFANGDVTFEKLTFKSATSDTSGTEFYAQNHKMVMGEGLKMGNEGTTVPGTGFPGVNKFRAYVFGGYENVADVADGTEMNTDITIRSGEYWFVAGWNRSKNGDTVHPENNGTGKITVGKVNDEDTLFIAYFVGYSVFNQYLNDDSKVTITIDGDVGIYKFVPLNHDGSRTVEEADLFETDVLLLKDSSINSGDSIPDTVVEDLTKYTTNAKVTIYADLRNEATLDEANHIKTYFDNRAKAGYVCEVHSYVEYCAKYFDGHTYVDGECSECGADENCPHESFETVTLEQPTCVANGKAYDMCNVCFARIKNKTDREYVDNNGTYKTAKDANAHLKSWVGDEYKCIRDGCGKVFGTGSTFYVSDNGNANGGFSATNPADDFAAIFEIASGCGSNATIYVVGSVSISHGYIDYDRAVFAEPNHQNEITVSGYNGLGVIKLKGENSSKIVYALNGPTTFENIEFSTRGYKITVASRYMYFVAQHNHLTFGEHIAFDFQRNAYESNMPCTPIIVGGCYNKKFAVNKDDNILATQCTGAETHITLKSGTFSDLRGGSVGGACGTPTINVEILGDVSFRKTVALGSSFNRAGDVNFTLDGSLVVNNYLSFGGENTAAAPNGANVGVVTLKLLNGSLHSQSFQTTSSTIRPLGASAFAEKDESGQSVFQVTKNLDKLRIYYDASAPSAVVTANRFKEMGDYADQSKIEYGFIDTLCTVAANGEHNNGGATGTRVDATCSIGAYTEYICSDCGKHYVVWDTDNPKLGHSFDTGVIAIVANCISPDILEMTCTRDGCDHSEYVVKEGSAPITDAHEFNDGICAYCQKTEQDVCAHDGAITTPYKTACGVGTKTECPVCHKVTIDVVSSKHNFGAYVVTVAPTENVPGIKTRTCKSCKKVETAVIYADGGAISSSAIATDASGNLANLDIIASKLTKAEKALLTAPSYGSELKISYKVEGDVVTGIIYSIPLPAEYKDYKNVQIVVKDDDGETYLVDFKVEKGYLVFEF